MNIGHIGAALVGVSAAGAALGMAGMGFKIDSVGDEVTGRVEFEKPVATARIGASSIQRMESTSDPGPQRSAAAFVTGELVTGELPRLPVEYVARDPSEWQGMLVRRSFVACADDGFCQRAQACIDGLCAPCLRNSDCFEGEVCALDHCVPANLATCTSYRDCPDEEVCVLSGYSDDLRGNGSMLASCSGSIPNREQVPVEHPPEAYLPNPSPMGKADRCSLP